MGSMGLPCEDNLVDELQQSEHTTDSNGASKQPNRQSSFFPKLTKSVKEELSAAE